MLTRKQHELLTYIDEKLRETGVSPSFEEMKAALDLRSKSGIHRLISALEERGFLRRHHHRARALEILRLPENVVQTQPGQAVALQAVKEEFTPQIIQGDFNKALPAVRVANDSVAVQLPLYGRIAAGLPIEAMRDDGTEVDVPVSLLGNGEHFALEVSGDSMIEAGILDGDTVIIRRAETADNGQIIVALVDSTEVTLKRLRRRGNSIALEPANKNYEPRLLPPDRVKIQGYLVALLRRY